MLGVEHHQTDLLASCFWAPIGKCGNAIANKTSTRNDRNRPTARDLVAPSSSTGKRPSAGHEPVSFGVVDMATLNGRPS